MPFYQALSFFMPTGFFLLFLNNCLTLFNSCSYCANFYCCCKIAILMRMPTKETKAEIKTQPVTVEAKISKCLT